MSATSPATSSTALWPAIRQLSRRHPRLSLLCALAALLLLALVASGIPGFLLCLTTFQVVGPAALSYVPIAESRADIEHFESDGRPGAGRFFPVPRGARIRVIGDDRSKTTDFSEIRQIRICEGIHKGQAGWVPVIWLNCSTRTWHPSDEAPPVPARRVYFWK